MTPCLQTYLSGDAYNVFLKSSSAIGKTLVECYLYWSVNGGCTSAYVCVRVCRVVTAFVDATTGDVRVHGDVWYDAVAVFLSSPKGASSMQLRALDITVTE